jgi:hypothetical protein
MAWMTRHEGCLIPPCAAERLCEGPSWHLTAESESISSDITNGLQPPSRASSECLAFPSGTRTTGAAGICSVLGPTISNPGGGSRQWDIGDCKTGEHSIRYGFWSEQNVDWAIARLYASDSFILPGSPARCWCNGHLLSCIHAEPVGSV